MLPNDPTAGRRRKSTSARGEGPENRNPSNPEFQGPCGPNCTLLSTQIPMYQGRLWEREEGKPGRGKTDEQTLRFCCLREVPTKASLGTHQSLGASQQDGEKRL